MKVGRVKYIFAVDALTYQLKKQCDLVKVTAHFGKTRSYSSTNAASVMPTSKFVMPSSKFTTEKSLAFQETAKKTAVSLAPFKIELSSSSQQSTFDNPQNSQRCLLKNEVDLLKKTTGFPPLKSESFSEIASKLNSPSAVDVHHVIPTKKRKKKKTMNLKSEDGSVLSPVKRF